MYNISPIQKWAKKQKTQMANKYPNAFSGWMDKENVAYLNNGIPLSHKKNFYHL